MEELTLEQLQPIATNLLVSWLEQFKPLLFKGHLYFPPCSEPGPLSPSHWLKDLQGGVGSYPSMPFSLEMWACHSVLGHSDNVDKVLGHSVIWVRKR